MRKTDQPKRHKGFFASLFNRKGDKESKRIIFEVKGKPVNRYEGCATLTPKWGEHKPPKSAVCFVFLFGRQVHDESKIEYAIRAGDLYLEIENGSVSPQDVGLAKKYHPIRVEAGNQEETTSRQTTNSHNVGIGPEFKFPLVIPLSPIVIPFTAKKEGSTTDTETLKRSSEYRKEEALVNLYFSSTRPHWRFFSKKEENQANDKGAFLDGVSDEIGLAAVKIHDLPIKVRYQFHVYPKDIHFPEDTTRGNGLSKVIEKIYHQHRVLKELSLNEIFCEGELVGYIESIGQDGGQSHAPKTY